LFNLFEILKDLFKPSNDSLVGLKHLNCAKIEPEIVKPKQKKEIKISDLMKKSILE